MSDKGKEFAKNFVLPDSEKKRIIENQMKIEAKRIIKNITDPLNDMIRNELNHLIY